VPPATRIRLSVRVVMTLRSGSTRREARAGASR
jgi:hypothetical protein